MAISLKHGWSETLQWRLLLLLVVTCAGSCARVCVVADVVVVL